MTDGLPPFHSLDPDVSDELVDRDTGERWAMLANTKTGGFVAAKTSWAASGHSPLVEMFKSADGPAPEGTTMTLDNAALLERVTKSDLTSAGDLGDGPSSSQGELGVDQVAKFLEIMSAGQVMLPEVRTVTSKNSKWQESVIQSGGRILRAGAESTVGATTSPALGTIEMNTGFFKAIIPVSDEFLEDAAAKNAQDSIARVIADQVGADVEDLCLNSKAASDDLNDNDAVYDVLADGGWLQQVEDGPGFYDATGDGQDYQTIFRQLLTSIPRNGLRGLVADGRFYVPVILEQKYRDALSARGTNLGDVTLQGTAPLSYQGIGIKSVPAMYVRTSSSPDHSHILLANKNNLVVGFQRTVKIEYWRDPREGQPTWVVTTRFDAKVEVPEFAAAAENIDVDA